MRDRVPITNPVRRDIVRVKSRTGVLSSIPVSNGKLFRLAWARVIHPKRHGGAHDPRDQTEKDTLENEQSHNASAGRAESHPQGDLASASSKPNEQ
jgi:hypothetical protein